MKHMMMTTVRGRFKELQATLTGDRDRPEDAGVEATISVASLDTGVADRDAHLRSADFFDADNHPQITFRTELDRQDWGLRWNQALETGGVLVANRVRVEGELQFVRDGE